jgi:hypothetical protein
MLANLRSPLMQSQERNARHVEGMVRTTHGRATAVQSISSEALAGSTAGSSASTTWTVSSCSAVKTRGFALRMVSHQRPASFLIKNQALENVPMGDLPSFVVVVTVELSDEEDLF